MLCMEDQGQNHDKYTESDGVISEYGGKRQIHKQLGFLGFKIGFYVKDIDPQLNKINSLGYSITSY